MLYKVRTVTGYCEMSAEDVRRELRAASYCYEGVSVMEHNAFMNEYYPIVARVPWSEVLKNHKGMLR